MAWRNIRTSNDETAGTARRSSSGWLWAIAVAGLVAALFIGLRLFQARERFQLKEEPKPAIAFIEESPEQGELILLRREEKLDSRLFGAIDELDSQIRLRHWASQQWDTRHRSSIFEPRWNARVILRQIRSRTVPGGLCSEYCSVLLQAYLAMGWRARIVSIESSDGAGHRVVEIWNKELGRWVLMDPMLDMHYERNGVPLNALDLHRALVSGETAGIEIVSLNRPPPLSITIRAFRHVTLFMRNNHLSQPSPVLNDWCVGIVDSFTAGRPYFSGHVTTRADLYYRDPDIMSGDDMILAE